MGRLKMPSLRTRAYIYRGLLTSAPLAVAYGVVTDAQVGLWLGAAAGWLGVGLATANTSLSNRED